MSQYRFELNGRPTNLKKLASGAAKRHSQYCYNLHLYCHPANSWRVLKQEMECSTFSIKMLKNETDNRCLPWVLMRKILSRAAELKSQDPSHSAHGASQFFSSFKLKPQ
jgi:hypothetical protein